MAVDLSLPLEEGMPIAPDHKGFEVVQEADYNTNGLLRHYFGANAHQGTHIDAPAHFIEGGATIDELDLEKLIGPAYVADLREYRGEPISADVIDQATPPLDTGDRIILVTGDVDEHFYDPHFFDRAAHITVSAAEWLVDQGVSIVANDFLTEAMPGDPARPVHHTILGAGIPVVEYICNTEEIAGAEVVELMCLPLRIPSFEATPTRVVARLIED